MYKRFDEMFLTRASESWADITSEEFLSYLKPKVDQALTWAEVEAKLSLNKPLRIKLGIDPTGSELHLGHLAPIMLLKQFLKAGHHVDFVIGDFTARIGDPSGRDTARRSLSIDEINENFKTYEAQINPYLKVSELSVRRNSEWLAQMTFTELFPLMQAINLSEAMQRDDFRNRAKNEQGVTLAEATYGMMMGIDSVNLNTDIELGGVDQFLNFQQCRTVMEALELPREAALTTPILEGIAGDGKKMGKSFNNYIALNATNEDKFGKIMSIPDNLVLKYFTSLADVNEKEVEELEGFIKKEPLEAKKQLGVFLVSLATGNIKDGEKERENFERKFSKKDVSDDDALNISGGKETLLLDVLLEVGNFESKSELRRLFEQNAVVAIGNDEKILSLDTLVGDAEGLIRVGKRKFFKVEVK